MNQQPKPAEEEKLSLMMATLLVYVMRRKLSPKRRVRLQAALIAGVEEYLQETTPQHNVVTLRNRQAWAEYDERVALTRKAANILLRAMEV